MAVTVTARGAGTTNAAGQSTLVVTPASNLAAGSTAVLIGTWDNSKTGPADPFSTIVDSVGNTWVTRQNVLNNGGSSLVNNGVATRWFESVLATALTTSDTITITFTNTTVARSWVLWEVIGGVYATGATNAYGNSNNPTMTTSSISTGTAVIAAVGREANAARNADADTSNGSWSTKQDAGVGVTTAGSDIISQYKVVTGNGTQTYNPTFGAAGDGNIGWVTYSPPAVATARSQVIWHG